MFFENGDDNKKSNCTSQLEMLTKLFYFIGNAQPSSYTDEKNSDPQALNMEKHREDKMIYVRCKSWAGFTSGVICHWVQLKQKGAFTPDRTHLSKHAPPRVIEVEHPVMRNHFTGCAHACFCRKWSRWTSSQACVSLPLYALWGHRILFYLRRDPGSPLGTPYGVNFYWVIDPQTLTDSEDFGTKTCYYWFKIIPHTFAQKFLLCPYSACLSRKTLV